MSLYERILADDETKDVDIEMSDGMLRAHSLVLCASSDAIKGMLRSGFMAGESQKKLSWREQDLETGRFFLRILYTGSFSEEDSHSSKRPKEATTADDKQREIPLDMLVGAFSIAKMYLVTPLLGELVHALKRRLSIKTFDFICAAAIKFDSTPLRFHCVEYAKNSGQTLIWSGGDAQLEGNAATGNGLVGFNRIDAMGVDRRETLVGFTIGTQISLSIRGQKYQGSVKKEPCENSHGEICFKTTAGYPDNIHDGTSKIIIPHGQDDIFNMFRAGTLSPQVQSELTGLWDEQPTKRRRREL